MLYFTRRHFASLLFSGAMPSVNLVDNCQWDPRKFTREVWNQFFKENFKFLREYLPTWNHNTRVWGESDAYAFQSYWGLSETLDETSSRLGLQLDRPRVQLKLWQHLPVAWQDLTSCLKEVGRDLHTAGWKKFPVMLDAH